MGPASRPKVRARRRRGKRHNRPARRLNRLAHMPRSAIGKVLKRELRDRWTLNCR